MANVKISELTAAGAITGVEVAPIVQSGETVKVTIGSMISQMANNVAITGGTIAGITGLTGAINNVTFDNNTQQNIFSDTYNSSSGSNILFRRARGTKASPTAIQTNDLIGQIQSRGYDGSAFSASTNASIRFIAAEIFTTIAHGAHIDFQTTPIGSITAVTVGRWGSTGNLLIGTTTDNATDKLQVNGSVTLRPLATATPPNNGDLTFEATSDTSLTFKYKGSDGVVRSASLTLA